MLVDRQADRLRLGEKIGAIPIDDSQGSAVEQILDLTGGEGADRSASASAGRRVTRPVKSVRT
jgi:threonine dehydrogenase-like Zn-dependent dehydrogenase